MRYMTFYSTCLCFLERKIIKVELESLWSQLEDNPSIETLFFYLFGTSEYDSHPVLRGVEDVICQKTWGKGGVAFRCMDCEQDTNCVVCPECYFDSEAKHATHRVKLIRTTGGCCDCGDVSSWNESGFCSKHGPNRNSAPSLDSPLLLSEQETCDLVESCENLTVILCEIITRSVTTEIDKEILKVCLEFFKELCRMSQNLLRPIVIGNLCEEVISPWIQVACVLAGSHPRPRPPVNSIPSREDCSEIAETVCDFFLSLVQMSAEFKLSFSKSFLTHYSQIVEFKGDFDESFRGDLASLSVQLFTIPEVCKTLLTSSGGNILGTILDALWALMAPFYEPATGRFGFREIRSGLDASIWRVIHDLGYCFHHESVCTFFLKDENLIQKFLRSIEVLQHANIQTVKTGDHVLYENVIWRTSFRIELLFMSTLTPLFEFARTNGNASLFISLIARRMEHHNFDLLQLAGEKASFHSPLSRMVTKSVSLENLIADSHRTTWIKEVFSLKFIRQLLLESLRPLLLTAEIAQDVWVRNGDAMRFQLDEYRALVDTDLTGVFLGIVLLEKLGFDAMTEFMRCLILLVADIPDDTTNDKTVLSDRLALFSDCVNFGPDQIDDWWQLFLRDVIIGGNGNPTDKRRRRAAFVFLIETLCGITTDSCSVQLTQLDLKIVDTEKRIGLITRCLVQRMPNQRLSYSQALNLLPSPLRQREYLLDQVLEKITVRERSGDAGGSSLLYKLNSEGLKLFDISHRTFSGLAVENQGMEEFALKNTFILGCYDEKDSISDFVTTALLSQHGLLLRMMSSLFRVRLCEHYCPHCLVASDSPQAETPPNQLDGVVQVCLKIIDNVKKQKAVSIFSESDNLWTRPPFGLKMQLQGLLQRTDLNGLSGIYFGTQEGRFCVSMADNGKLLAKESNTCRLRGPEVFSYAVSLLSLMEDLAALPRQEFSELNSKAAKILIKRFAECTGLESDRNVRSASPTAGENKLKALETKQRQQLLMSKMKQKQSKFSHEVGLSEQPQEMSDECAMCREARSNDPIVAIGYCAAGNSIARTSPSGVCIASPASPYINACLHTVHMSCWKKHCDSSSLRTQRGEVFLLRQNSGEVQCPVCRTLANIAIPIVTMGEVSDEIFEAVVELGESILGIAKEHSKPRFGVEDLWLSSSRKSPRPIIFSPASDALAEAAFNELLLSISLSPSRVLSASSLHVVLVRCLRASFRNSCKQETSAWSRDEFWNRASYQIDCARLFLESTCYEENRDFVKNIMILRHMQLGSAGDFYDTQMAHLAVFIAWVVAAVSPSFTPADINRIGYLPEDPKARLAVVEQLLDIADWRKMLVGHPQSIGPMPHATGGLVEFIKLPEKLTDLIGMTINRNCEKCKTQPQDPAICLLCGTLVCLDSDCCKEPEGEGECTKHAETCGAGQGVFILPYASIVVAVASPRNCIWEGPYEDSHGEPDSYMKRTCKLTLGQHRLDQMRLFYTRGSIPIEIVKQNQITGRYVPRQL